MDIVSRMVRELPDTDQDRYDIAYARGRAQARSAMLFGGLAAGLLGGAIGTFLLDPARGRARRIELGQRLTGLRNDLQRTAEGRGKDLRNRAMGAATEMGLPGTPSSNEERRAEQARTRVEQPRVFTTQPRASFGASPSGTTADPMEPVAAGTISARGEGREA